MADDIIQLRLRPTLILGLGGTGHKIAVELKARLEEQLGDSGSSGWNRVIKILCFDTATEDLAAFQPNHPTRAPIRLNPDQEIVRISDVPLHDLMRSRDTNEAIGAIFPEILYSTHIDQGAQQIRRLGRIALFYHYQRVKDRISQAIKDLRRVDVIGYVGKTPDDKQLYVTDRNRLRVYILTSLCGGTGAGTFIDLAYMVRHIAVYAGIPSERACEVIGMLLLPEAFPQVVTTGAARIQANAYASLLDLEYYNQVTSADEKLYRVNFPDDPIEVAGPPFSLCYLVNGSGPGGTVRGMRDLGPALADALVQMVASRVGQQLDAVVDNIRASLTTYHKGYRAFYSALGVAQIIYPFERLKQQFGQRLKQEVIRRYILSLPDDRSWQTDVEVWYEQQNRWLQGRLVEHTEDLRANVTRRLQTLAEELPFRNDLSGMVNDLETAYRAGVRQFQQSVVGQIQDNAAQAQDALKAQLAEDLRRAIDQGLTKSGGLRWAVHWLEELRKKLDGITHDELASTSADHHAVFVQQMSAIHTARSAPIVGNWRARQQVPLVCQALQTYLDREAVEKTVQEALRSIYLGLMDAIEQHRRDIVRAISYWQQQLAYTPLSEALDYPLVEHVFDKDDLEEHVNRAVADFLTNRSSSVARQVEDNLYGAQLAEHLGDLKHQLPEADYTHLIENLSMTISDFLAGRGGTEAYKTLDDFKEQLSDRIGGLSASLVPTEYERIGQTLIAFCEQQYDNVARHQDVIEYLVQEKTDLQRQEMLQAMGQKAQPLLGYNDGLFQHIPTRQIRVLGANTREAGEKHALPMIGHQTDLSVVPTYIPSTLSLIVTHHGIPAFALSKFDDYRINYQKLLAERNAIFHLDTAREREPFDPGSYYFINLEDFHAYFGRALAHGWIDYIEGFFEDASCFAFRDDFFDVLASVISDNLRQIKNEKTRLAQSDGGETNAEYQDAVLLARQLQIMDENIADLEMHLELFGAYQYDSIHSEPNGGGHVVKYYAMMLPGDETTAVPALKLTEARDAIFRGKSRLLPQLFIQAVRRYYDTYHITDTRGADIDAIDDFFGKHHYVEYAPDDTRKNDQVLLWSEPGEAHYELALRLCAILSAYRRVLERRQRNVRAGYLVETVGKGWH